MGVVRKRELETHQSRLDMEAYEQYVTRLPCEQSDPSSSLEQGLQEHEQRKFDQL